MTECYDGQCYETEQRNYFHVAAESDVSSLTCETFPFMKETLESVTAVLAFQAQGSTLLINLFSFCCDFVCSLLIKS